MNESSKSIFGKLADARYATRYLVGDGIDIGAGSDSLWQYHELFPLMKSCRAWDVADGDAQLMQGVPDLQFDFVHSSHCLEHLRNPFEALNQWLRILKTGGHLVCIVPDEDLYEQGVFPSTYNADHKHTFTIHKQQSWSSASINLTELLAQLSPHASLLKLELKDATYRYQLPSLIQQARFDQTLTPIGESGIEFILRKL
jgi:SAM-dependent methyltransferase